MRRSDGHVRADGSSSANYATAQDWNRIPGAAAPMRLALASLRSAKSDSVRLSRMRSYNLRASPDLGHGDWYAKQDEQMMANGYETLSLERDSGREVKPAEVPVLGGLGRVKSRIIGRSACDAGSTYCTLPSYVGTPSAPPLLAYATPQTRPQTRTVLWTIR